jgi:hypothetical protein
VHVPGAGDDSSQAGETPFAAFPQRTGMQGSSQPQSASLVQWSPRQVGVTGARGARELDAAALAPAVAEVTGERAAEGAGAGAETVTDAGAATVATVGAPGSGGGRRVQPDSTSPQDNPVASSGNAHIPRIRAG